MVKCWSETVAKQNNHIASFTTDRHSFNNPFNVVTNTYKVCVICVWTNEDNGESSDSFQRASRSLK